MKGRIVITGVGVLSPIGTGREAYWESLADGTMGFRPITLFDTTPFSVHTAGEIAGFDPVAILGKKGLRDLDRSTQLLCAAAKAALDDARLPITDEIGLRSGVSIGTTFGSLHSISQFDRSGLVEGPRLVNPSHFPNTVINSPASQVSIRFKIKGFNTTISTGFCAGLDAISYAADFLRMNRADAVLAGGVEELCEETFLLFHNLGYLSGTDGGEPVSRPFDARRDGCILSEGAAVLVLEQEEHAHARGGEILAVIMGSGSAFDPLADGSFGKASGKGLQTAIELALREAGLVPYDIDLLCACANSTADLDRLEARVIRDVFQDHANSMPVSSIKSMAGEAFSASGALAVAAAIGAIRDGFVPPTVNYEMRDPMCDLNGIANKVRQQRIRHVLVTASDPYGQNSAVVIGSSKG
jgi:3-oxoacyl-[acyl-carrier-protein] synthase II